MGRKVIGHVDGERTTTEVVKHDNLVFESRYYANNKDDDTSRGSFNSADKAFDAAEEMSPGSDDD
ncbi:MAG: hypothetical protein AAB534_02450 [Patescibacteria group bacterium]